MLKHRLKHKVSELHQYKKCPHERQRRHAYITMDTYDYNPFTNITKKKGRLQKVKRRVYKKHKKKKKEEKKSPFQEADVPTCHVTGMLWCLNITQAVYKLTFPRSRPPPLLQPPPPRPPSPALPRHSATQFTQRRPLWSVLSAVGCSSSGQPGVRKREKVRRSFCTSTTWMTSLLSSAISDTCNTWRWVYSIKEEEGEEGEEEEEEEDEEEEEEGERKKERKKEMRWGVCVCVCVLRVCCVGGWGWGGGVGRAPRPTFRMANTKASFPEFILFILWPRRLINKRTANFTLCCDHWDGSTKTQKTLRTRMLHRLWIFFFFFFKVSMKSLRFMALV